MCQKLDVEEWFHMALGGETSGFWGSGRIFFLDLVASYTGELTLGKPSSFAVAIHLFTSLYVILTE